MFTSGATESNNLAIKAVAHLTANEANTLLLPRSSKCVLDCCRFLEQEGYEVTYLAVGEATGRVDMDTLKAALEMI